LVVMPCVDSSTRAKKTSRWQRADSRFLEGRVRWAGPSRQSPARWDPATARQSTRALVQESDQVLDAAWLLQLAHRLGFDLSNPFARYFEDVSDFFERIAVTVTETVTQFDNFAFTIAEGLEHVVDAF